MRRLIGVWQMIGFVATSILGTLLHFAFDNLGKSPIVALFSPVNESIWEHLKLLYIPMVLVAVVEYWRIGQPINGFWCVKLQGILLGNILIPVLYYTYTGVLGPVADWVNIALFFLVAAVVYRFEAIRLKHGACCGLSNTASLIFIGLVGILFAIWTFFPPRIPLFLDPVSGTYGFR